MGTTIGSVPVLQTGTSRDQAKPIEPVPKTGSSNVLEPTRPNDYIFVLSKLNRLLWLK